MEEEFLYDVYMLCPVRKATPKEKEFLKKYKQKLEQRGFKAHYPADDTIQEDDTGGYRICKDHCEEIFKSRTIHVYWNGQSTGSYVDLGTSLGEHHRRGLDILLMNRKDVETIVKKQEKQGIIKSYERVLLKLDRMANNLTRISL